MKQFMLGCLIGLTLLGCGLIGNIISEDMADAIGKYCASVSPHERLFYHDTINRELAPNSIDITCAIDQPGGKPDATQDLRNDQETIGIVRYVCAGYENSDGYTTLDCVRTGTRATADDHTYYPKPITASSPAGTARPVQTIAPCLSCTDA